jgi:ribosomal protein S18 acetylase RimI-like enzyme
MSLYAKYLTEKTEDMILEREHGFATYRITTDLNEQKTVYIIDIYVDSDFRKSGLASQMADEITEIAKKENCTKMFGSVVPSTKNSTASLSVLLAYGMKLNSSTNDFILFEKEL